MYVLPNHREVNDGEGCIIEVPEDPQESHLNHYRRHRDGQLFDIYLCLKLAIVEVPAKGEKRQSGECFRLPMQLHTPNSVLPFARVADGLIQQMQTA
jgi:hypothetical protein